jgi:hypothetical protein
MGLRQLNHLAAVGGARSSSSRMPSRSVWQSCPAFELEHGLKDGFIYFDDLFGDYIQAANVAATASTLDAPWCAFTDATAGATIASGVDVTGSMVFNSTTAQEGCIASLHTALNSSAPIPAPTATNRIWFEARVKLEHTTTQYASMFLGLAERARTVTLGTIATGGAAAAAVDLIGFHYTAAATTAVTTVTSNGTATVIDSTAAVVAADTYTKLGFYWDGAKFTFFQDDAALSDTLALGATQFPAGENLAPYWQLICGSDGTTTSATLDWVRYAFERDFDDEVL